jgi:uncharacterized protein
MKPLIFIALFLILFFYSSFGQNPKQKKSKEITIAKTVYSKSNPLKDTAFINKLSRLNRDSVNTIIDSLLNNTTFLKSIDDSSEFGEFASVIYKILYPLKSLGWTSDYEQIFSSQEVTELDSILNDFEYKTSNEIVVVTFDSSWTTKEKFDDFVKSIHNDWGVGKKHKNNGIVIGICTNLRKIRINNGYGIELKLTDKETKKIIDEIMLPEYKKGNYFEGTKNGILALMQKVR